MHLGRSWDVRPAAERRSSTADWQLVFAFRPVGGPSAGRTRWAVHPRTGRNKASLFVQADLVTDDDLAALLEGVLRDEGG